MRAFQQADPQLTFQPPHLLAQRRRQDVLVGGGAAEVQFLGQRHEMMNTLDELCPASQVAAENGQPLEFTFDLPMPGISFLELAPLGASRGCTRCYLFRASLTFALACLT